MQHGYALVSYDTLSEDEAGTQPLQEWFRIPPPPPAPGSKAVPARPHAGLVAAADAAGQVLHEGLNYQLRPQPPAEVCVCACVRACVCVCVCALGRGGAACVVGGHRAAEAVWGVCWHWLLPLRSQCVDGAFMVRAVLG
jgi:hypothetical protein